MIRDKIVGYDISDTSCQISYYSEDLQEPETYEASPESFQIPMVIGKRHSTWAIGIDAKRLEILHEGKLATNLIEKSIEGSKIVLENQRFEASYLLARFVKMSLSKFEHIQGIVFTVSKLNQKIVEILKRVAIEVGIPEEEVYVQDYRESFCNYMFYQPRELWQYEAALFYCDKKEVSACMLKNIKTEMKYTNCVFVEADQIADAKKKEMDVIYPLIHGEKAREADARFRLFIEHVFDQRTISSVYLTGEGFENTWYPESLKTLCNGRRAFLGNNLYSKGACYTAYRRFMNREDGFIYIDENKTTERICIKIRNNNQNEWFPLVTWGNLWYECGNTWEILLEDTEDIELHIESLYRGKVQIEQISLEEVPERASYSIRLKIEVIPIEKDTFKIRFIDQGFGDFYPSSGYETETIIKLGGYYGQYHSLSKDESGESV